MIQNHEPKNDTYFIKLTGKAEVPNKFETGDKVGIAIEGSITAVTESDNHDGTFTYYAKFTPMIVKMVNNKGKVLSIRDVRGLSSRQRSAYYRLWNEKGIEGEFNDYYERRMIAHIRSILAELDN
jgi:hypothetical protein